MDRQIDITTDLFGQKTFTVVVTFTPVTIEDIISAMLISIEDGFRRDLREGKPPNPAWDTWTRALLLANLEYQLTMNGQSVQIDREELQKLYPTLYETASRFVEEFFPELVYNYKDYRARVKGHYQELRGGRHSKGKKKLEAFLDPEIQARLAQPDDGEDIDNLF